MRDAVAELAGASSAASSAGACSAERRVEPRRRASCAPTEGEIDARVAAQLERARQAAEARCETRRSRDGLSEPARRGGRSSAQPAIARRRPAPPPRPRPRPDRAGHRGHRPARPRSARSAWSTTGRDRARRCRPRWSASATAATLLMPLGEMHGIGPGNAGDARPASRSGCRSARRCSAACSTGSAGRSTAAEPAPPARRARRSPPPPRPAGAAADRERRRRSACARSTRFVPCGRGQRLGIFAGSGVGKSSLLGMIARSTTADVNVIALVGERGREVREFVERDLGDALARSVVVVATSDQPALVRIKAAFAATDDRRALPRPGRRRAADDGLGDPLRDGPARGRPGDRRAAGDARLHARASSPCCRGCSSAPGTSPDGLDHRPLHRAGRRRRHERADRRRGALDPRRPRRAHARRSPTPATTRRSTSSRASRAWPTRSRRRSPAAAGQRLRALLAAYRDKEDLISIGAYQPGGDPDVDAAIAMRARDRRLPAPARRGAAASRRTPTAPCRRSPPRPPAPRRLVPPESARRARARRADPPRPGSERDPAAASQRLTRGPAILWSLLRLYGARVTNDSPPMQLTPIWGPSDISCRAGA